LCLAGSGALYIQEIYNMAKYLVPANFTEKTVSSSAMLQVGGGVAPGTYVRTRRNTIISPTLIRRFGDVSSAMKAQCSQPDACTRNTKLVGKMNAKGKVYRLCDPAEAAARLSGARECAMRTLPSV